MARQVHILIIERDAEVVRGGVPPGSLDRAHVETMVREEDAKRLDPGEVAPQLRVVLADEVGIDVEVFVRDDAKVPILLAMEVEIVAVSARETGIAARDTSG